MGVVVFGTLTAIFALLASYPVAAFVYLAVGEGDSTPTGTPFLFIPVCPFVFGLGLVAIALGVVTLEIASTGAQPNVATTDSNVTDGE